MYIYNYVYIHIGAATSSGGAAGWMGEEGGECSSDAADAHPVMLRAPFPPLLLARHDTYQ